MRSIRIFSGAALHSGEHINLEPGATRHVAQVLRMRVGDELILFDDSGGEYPALIELADRHRVTVALGERREVMRESSLEIELWHGIGRSDRMDVVVQKATELGVIAILPVLTARGSVRLPAARALKKMEHWRRIAISACEQCGRNRIPVVREPMSMSAALESPLVADQAILLHPDATKSLAELLQPSKRIVVLTGPEGGFTDAETTAAKDAGFNLAHLGPRILRTETAPLVALGIIQAMAGDLSRSPDSG